MPEAAIICKTPYRPEGLQLSIFDDGYATISNTVAGNANRRGGVCTIIHLSADDARRFVCESAEILGLFVSEQPATVKGSAT